MPHDTITRAARADDAANALVDLIDTLDQLLEPGSGRVTARRQLEQLATQALTARSAMRHSSAHWDDIVAHARTILDRERTPLNQPAARLRRTLR